jgi:ribonuclease VapC
VIALDTSALFAIAAGEPDALACAGALMRHRGQTVLSAVTFAECQIVSGGRGLGHLMDDLLAEIEPEIVAVDGATAIRAAAVYRAWGKGHHPARLNFCDCFAYLLAQERDIPLLFIGDDFGRTDIRSALPL